MSGCDRPAIKRGLCKYCYQDAEIAILKGRLTWEILIENGYALPPEKERTAARRLQFLTDLGIGMASPGGVKEKRALRYPRQEGRKP